MKRAVAITEAEYASIEVDAVLRLADGEVVEVTAFPDGRPWASSPAGPSRPIAREQIVAVRNPKPAAATAVPRKTEGVRGAFPDTLF